MSETRFPGIYRACLLIALDNGGINRTRSVERQRREYERWLSSHPDEMLQPIDAWFTSLSDEDLDMVCTGGTGEPEVEALRAQGPPFSDDLLNDYFEKVC